MSKFYTGIDVVRATEWGYIVNIPQLRAAVVKLIKLLHFGTVKYASRRDTIRITWCRAKLLFANRKNIRRKT